MSAFRLNVKTDTGSTACGFVGGAPHLPELSDWPRCRLCNSELVAFLDLVLPKSDASPFQPGSRLQVFTCREHDDIPGPIYSDYSPFVAASRMPTLPPEYWNLSDGHYLLRLLPPSQRTHASQPEPRLLPQAVNATATEDDYEEGFQLLGEPFWLQNPETHHCSCGAPMKLLLQIPDGYGFPMAAGAERQPNSFSNSDYCIFLGNQLYLLGCTNQCHPQALWPVLQS